MKERQKVEVTETFKRAERLPRHELKELFTNVYAGEEPWNIVRYHGYSMTNNRSLMNVLDLISHCRSSNGKSWLPCWKNTAKYGSHGKRSSRNSKVPEKSCASTKTESIDLFCCIRIRNFIAFHCVFACEFSVLSGDEASSAARPQRRLSTSDHHVRLQRITATDAHTRKPQ